MKKVTVLLVLLGIINLVSSSQDLGDIIRKYEKATGADNLNNYETLTMEGSLSQMGMELTMLVMEKKPEKLKTVMAFNGMEMVTVVNGDKGYTINPMTGSNESTPLTDSQISQIKNNRNLSSTLSDLYGEGKLSYEGEENFRGIPCYRIRMNTVTGDIYAFINKSTYLMAGMKMKAEQMGQEMNIEALMKEYKDFEGIKMAVKVDTYLNGNLGYTVEFTRVEFDSPIPDSEFEIK